MKRIAERDERALEILYDRYSKVLYTLALKIVGDVSESEDIVQETFVRIWEKASHYEEVISNPYTWMVTICRNRAIDKLRARDRRVQGKEALSKQSELASHSGSLGPFEIVAGIERQEIVKQALQNLSIGQREVLEMAYFKGLSQSEIAATLNEPLGTIKTRARQGMIKLRQTLKEYFQARQD